MSIKKDYKISNATHNSIVRKLRDYAKKLGNNTADFSDMDFVRVYCASKNIEPPTKAFWKFWAYEIMKSGKCEILNGKNIPKVERKKKTKPKEKNQKYIVSDLFFQLKEWELLRRKALRTYGCKCMKCGAEKCEMHVDHIKPRSRFPNLQFEFSNLQVLCRNCNMEKGYKDTTDYRPKK